MIKFASIDIGSNAVRLLFCNVNRNSGDTIFKKTYLIRISLRLGEDVFLKRKISKRKEDKLITAMKIFSYLIRVYGAVNYRAYATSAMRDAVNNKEIIRRIRKEAGLRVEIIDGKTEASILCANHVAEKLSKRHSYLYIDVGGGSTEVSFFVKGKCIVSRSFNVGAIRMLYDKIDPEYWKDFKKWLRDITRKYKSVIAIGTGGNINKLYKLSGLKRDEPLSYNKLKILSEEIESCTLEDRIKILGLRPDRADVIVPASKIVLSVMENGKIKQMLVPQIGLSDGIVHRLYEEYKG